MSELPELVQALLDPGVYPQPPDKVELIQTQISYVFMAGDLVYKVKKPVDFGFLDYSTLDKRLSLCVKEVQLNQRLCPDAYLGVVPVTRDDGRTVMDGIGDILEYAVQMRRLPREAMMDVLLPEDKVTEDMVRRVAVKLADFHASAATGEGIDEYGDISVVRKTVEDIFVRDGLHIGEIIDTGVYDRILAYERNFLDTNGELFARRISDGRIRDCHGDLHAQHVCFGDGDSICIYDCIEFSDSLRYIDTAADIAFLAMDLDRHGRQDLAGLFIDTYVERSGDTDILTLLNFYKTYRAGVRYMVNCQQYDDPQIPASEKERISTTARHYAALAETYVT